MIPAPAGKSMKGRATIPYREEKSRRIGTGTKKAGIKVAHPSILAMPKEIASS